MKASTIKQFGLLFLLFISISQMNATVNKSPGKAKTSAVLNMADIAFRDMKYSIAADYYQSYLKDSSNVTKEILSKLCECYWQMHQFNKALEVYQKSFPVGKQGTSTTDRYRIAELYARKGQYQKASEWLQGIEGYESKASVYSNPSQLEKLKKDSLNWNLKFLNINTGYREFAPYLKGKVLYFSSNKIPGKKIKSYGWDGDNYSRLWEVPLNQVDSIDYSDIASQNINRKSVDQKLFRLSGIFEDGDNKTKLKQSAYQVKDPILAADSVKFGSLVSGLNAFMYNAGTISIDKNNRIYFSSNYKKPDKSGINRIRIMQGVISINKISNINPLPFSDANSYSVMHPAINKDGNILVFSSDKPGGKGGFDLYYSRWNDSLKTWNTMQSFGGNVNQKGNEVFPNISEQGNLYFSSDILPGLGGLDIYRIPLKDALNGNGTPEHISYPINSSADDFGVTFDSIETKGYFSSDRLNDNDNIYSFNFNTKKRPFAKTSLDGFVIEQQTMIPIKGATVFLWNSNQDTVIVAKTNDVGYFSIQVTQSGKYVIKAIEKKHTNNCMTMGLLVNSVFKDTIQSLPHKIALDRFKAGFKWKLNNILYDFDKWNIRTDARPILDSLILVLNTYPINIELSSHTDCRGTLVYNDRLSQHRAESVVEYLISHGIAPQRITAKGYGEWKLLNKCSNGIPCSETEHQANRRTEVKVTGYTVAGRESEMDSDKFANGQKITIKDLPSHFFETCK
jgi:outer membrane protein OmpA-like peptidoglycan-associated protein/tetratricopeptide (TPR) repeat protein